MQKMHPKAYNLITHIANEFVKVNPIIMKRTKIIVPKQVNARYINPKIVVLVMNHIDLTFNLTSTYSFFMQNVSL